MTGTPQLTRRGILAAGGAAVIGALGGCSASTPPSISSGTTRPSASAPSSVLAFHGTHQPGVHTPPALLQTFLGLDLADDRPHTADAVLRLVSDDAARLMRGEPALGDTEPDLARHPARLSITVGLGRPLFERTGRASAVPPELVDLPAFSTDRLQERWSQTDLLLQVGSDDALTLAHTIRMLTKDLSSLTTVRWVQPGFRSAAPAVAGGSTTRNLMGQVDGTVNPAPDSPEFDEAVWIDNGDPWVVGGTVLVLRRIRMLMDQWDILDRSVQEQVIGRHITTGAPIGEQEENDPVPWDAIDDRGFPVIADNAHIRVAHALSTESMILRRPYSYDNGIVDGTNDVGLLFAAYMRDPRASFIPMQERIAASDAFNRWNTTIGSAVYVLPGGVGESGYLAEGVFA